MTTTEPTTGTTTPRVTRYSMKVPLLTSGRSNQVLARTDTVEVRAKVYAEGGENALHSHLDEDHTFFVLDGEATFYGPDEQSTVVGRYGGAHDPRRGVLPLPVHRRHQSRAAALRCRCRRARGHGPPRGRRPPHRAGRLGPGRQGPPATSRCQPVLSGRSSARTDTASTRGGAPRAPPVRPAATWAGTPRRRAPGGRCGARGPRPGGRRPGCRRGSHRPLRPPTEGPGHRGEVRCGVSIAMPMCARSTGVPRCRASRSWCSQSL